jgi:hypothetical protein
MPLAEAARRVMAVRTADVAAWSAYVDQPSAVTELHNMRIAAKRLRYSMELLQPALPEEALPLLDRVQQLQEHLGAIHDDDVLQEMLRRHVATSALDGALARADQIIATHGAAGMDTSLPASVRGLFVLLGNVAARREERYQSFRRWWAAQDDLLSALHAVGQLPLIVL